jgi:hypothetical protein
MFAMPKFRENIPGIPKEIGLTFDIVGFCWNIFMVAVSGVVMLVIYVNELEKRRLLKETGGLDEDGKAGGIDGIGKKRDSVNIFG